MGDGKGDLQLARVPLDSLVEDPRNARLHDERNLAGIRSSLENFGQREPLVVRDGVVIGGNGRLRAMRDLGWDTCLVTDHGDLTEAQARALGVVLNRTAEVGTTWDAEQLRLTVAECSVECPEIELDVGDLPELTPEPVEPDETPAPDPLPDAISERGDIITLGPHRVMCGDSTSAEDVGALLAGEKPGLMVTDPPYGIGAPKMTLGKGKKEFHRGDWDGAAPSVAHLLDFEHVAIWGGNYFSDQLPVSNDWLCWHKVNDGRSFGEFELAWSNFGRQTRHIAHHWSGEEKRHPTQKPLAVIRWCLEQAPQGDDVADFYLGSGTTLIAADQLGRTCYGMELEPRYVDVIVRRWVTHCEKAGKDPQVVGWRGSP